MMVMMVIDGDDDTFQEDIKYDSSCSCTTIIQAIDGYTWKPGAH